LRAGGFSAKSVWLNGSLRIRMQKLQLSGFVLFLGGCLGTGVCHAQSLAPRAYVITPIHSNAITVTYSFYDGGFQFEGAIPITGATAKINITDFSFYHSFNFFGRSANFTASLPYAVGNFQGNIVGNQETAYRSGLLPATFRLSVNLIGGPAMNVQEFAKWQQKTIVGFSFTFESPTGQYDPTRLINYGVNRWAFKPELGLSRRWGHWLLDAYAGAWFFTTNPEYFSHNAVSPGTNTQDESPTGSFEFHLSYDVKPRFWVSLDGNFWFGGETSVNGVQTPGTVQRSSRVGVTGSVPLTNHQSLKFSYSDGAYVQYGGNYQKIAVAWQYSWFGRPN